MLGQPARTMKLLASVRPNLHNSCMTKISKSPARKKTVAKMPAVLRSAVKPTHFTRAEIRRAVKEVIAERGKVHA